jgi:hypothetical protein
MKILVTLLLVVIVILNFVSLVTPNWSVDYPYKVGLWQFCTGSSCEKNNLSDHAINTVRAFAIISTLISLLPFVLFFFLCRGRMWVVRVCLILIFICCLINIFVYMFWSILIIQKNGKVISTPKSILGYSFYLQVTIFFLCILAFGLSFLKKKKKKKTGVTDEIDEIFAWTRCSRDRRNCMKSDSGECAWI